MSMRTFATVVVVLLLFLGFGTVGPAPTLVAHAQQDSTVLMHVERAFRSGDVEALLSGSAERIDVVIFGKGASYSRNQASLVLLDFFRRNPPRNVDFEQQVLADDRRSVAGHYWATRDDEPIAVSVRLKARRNGWQVRAVRIERRGR